MVCVVLCVVTLPSLPVSEPLAQCHSGICLQGNMLQTPINTASAYHSSFSGVGSSESGSRFDTVEVSGSNPLAPTITFNGLAVRSAVTLIHNPIHNFIGPSPKACRVPEGIVLAPPVSHRSLLGCTDRESSGLGNAGGSSGQSWARPSPY